MKLSEIVPKVIELATAVNDFWARELPKHHPTYPVIPVGEDSGPPPREENELRSLLEGLPEDLNYMLILLMYLGRGDFGVNDLEARYLQLKSTFPKPEWAVSQMLSKATLSDYLSDGLAELKKHHIDVDHLLNRPSRRAKAS